MLAEHVQSNLVGAGIVGLAVALSLQQSGRRVRLFDRGAPDEDTSFGNAGIVSFASIVPEAEPNIWKATAGCLTQAAITEKLLTALASGRKPELDLAPYRIDRF